MFLNDSHRVYKGVVKNGMRVYYQPAQHTAALQQLEGKEFGEIIMELEEPAAPDFHGYYRGAIINKVCRNCGLFEGWDPEEIHEYFKDQFMAIPVQRTLHGEPVIIRRQMTTKGISKKRMKEFVERVIRWLNMNGIEVPDSSEWLLNKYKSQDGKTHQSDPEKS